MAYFPDLSPYRYEEIEPIPGVFHVGWLDGKHDYTRGTVRPHAVDKLVQLAATRAVRRMRGIHQCELCLRDNILITYEAKPFLLGSAEVWIPAGTSEIYAAPDLILHYVGDHEYLPPQQFLAALDELDVETWQAPKEAGW